MQSETTNDQIERWGTFELVLEGSRDGNPFLEVELSTQFRQGHRPVDVKGFYDGEGVYRVRFMPDTEGLWSFVTTSNRSELDGITGRFACVPPSAGNHGPVQVANTYHFAYADGTPYRQIGTTCYVWTHQGHELEEQTLATLKTTPFNKLRMCVFPKHYTFNHNEPTHYPFDQYGDTGWDFSRFNPAFFRHLEGRVADLQALGIEADVILFHAYDRWGFSKMGPDEDDRYLRYIVARLAAFRNVWWSMANEYDIMRSKTMSDWDRFFRVVQENDPYQHLRSIHNWQNIDTHDTRTFYDHNKPWVTHCSVQHGDTNLAHTWRELYRKPVVMDEVCYEGDLPNAWGNLTAEEMVRRFWEGTVYGGYVGHGETFLHPEEIIWWSKGGHLYGQSPERLAFLRHILEEGPPEGIDPVGQITNTHLSSAGKIGAYYLSYFGYRQPGRVEFTFPAGEHYQADVIDTWEMTITPMADPVEHGTTVELPRKPYQAIRLRRHV